MRALLGLLLLLLAFAAAALWQGGRLERLRARAGPPRGTTSEVPDDGRVHLVLGRPSGAPPLLATSGAGDEDQGLDPPLVTTGRSGKKISPERAGRPPDAPAAVTSPQVFELRVRPGQTLSVICEEFYGTSRGGIVDRVAHWNGLTSPDRLRAGSVLELPPWESLALPPPERR